MMSQSTAWKNVDDIGHVASPNKAELLCAGLCANCAHADFCGVLASSRQPIQQCELYECCSQGERQERITASTRCVAEPETLHFMGLCANCDSRRDCKLPKPSSGVWHCEEYR